MGSAFLVSHARPCMLVDVISANVHPSQPIGRPVPPPAAVVAGVEERRADEEEAMMEAVVESEPWRECGMCDMCAAEMRTADTHRGDMRAAHGMHAAARGMPAGHAAAVHSAAAHHHAATAAATGERR